MSRFHCAGDKGWRGALRGLWGVLRRPSGRFSLGFLLVAGVAGGLLLIGGGTLALEMTSSETFCRSCHEMETTSYREFRTTAHDQNAAGVRASCPDCHVPHAIGRKLVRKLVASREVFHHLTGAIDTPEKFETARGEMAERVWKTMKETDSAECRTCHTATAMDLMRENERARDAHAGADRAGQTCIDCHKGIAHHLPAGTEALEARLNHDWTARQAAK